MMTQPQTDPSNGWDQVAAEFIALRSGSDIGVAELRQWAQLLAPGAAVLDLGCGFGWPVSHTLQQLGFDIHAIDASAQLVAEFRRQLPTVQVRCETVAESDFYQRSFAGIVAIGLLFLLPAAQQLALLRKMAAALTPGGLLLFSAPWQQCEWLDLTTGRRSLSLGRQAYLAAAQQAELTALTELTDAGGNHYFCFQKLSSDS